MQHGHLEDEDRCSHRRVVDAVDGEPRRGAHGIELLLRERDVRGVRAGSQHCSDRRGQRAEGGVETGPGVQAQHATGRHHAAGRLEAADRSLGHGAELAVLDQGDRRRPHPTELALRLLHLFAVRADPQDSVRRRHRADGRDLPLHRDEPRDRSVAGAVLYAEQRMLRPPHLFAQLDRRRCRLPHFADARGVGHVSMICRVPEAGLRRWCTRRGDEPCTIGQPTLPHRPSRGTCRSRRRTRNLGTSPNAKEAAGCRPISRQGSTSKRSRQDPGRSRAWGLPSPRSSGWPRRARSTSRRWSRTGPSSPRLRRLRRELLPRPRRLRLVPQRRRQLLRRPDRRNGQRAASATARPRDRAPPQGALGGFTASLDRDGGRGGKKHRPRRRGPPAGTTRRDDEFKLVVTVDGKPTETYDNVTTKGQDNNVATKVNAALQADQPRGDGRRERCADAPGEG